MSEERQSRLCACGCGRPARPRSKYADYERCKQRAYLTVLDTPTSGGNGDASKPARPVRRRQPEMRISYRKAVDAVERMLQENRTTGRRSARQRAEDALRPLLSQKARGRA